MNDLLRPFEGFPSQREVAKVMLRYGISVRGDEAYCGEVRIGDSALARAAEVDRRVVRSTIERIAADKMLYRKFSKLKSMCLLSDVAPEIGCSTLEIMPIDSQMPGILADVTGTIFEAGVSVRQAVIDDSGPNGPMLIIVLDGQLPDSFLPRIRRCRGVDSVTIR